MHSHILLCIESINSAVWVALTQPSVDETIRWFAGYLSVSREDADEFFGALWAGHALLN